MSIVNISCSDHKDIVQARNAYIACFRMKLLLNSMPDHYEKSLQH